jgi:hypothetical protein
LIWCPEEAKSTRAEKRSELGYSVGILSVLAKPRDTDVAKREGISSLYDLRSLIIWD